MTRPAHLFIGSSTDGDLYDTRSPDWTREPLRRNFERHHLNLTSLADLKACLRAGPYAWPGGYPLYFLCDDGDAVSFKAVRSHWTSIVREYMAGNRFITGCLINWEDPDLHCDLDGQRIESAYAEPEEN
jgi:hypothetical protein